MEGGGRASDRGRRKEVAAQIEAERKNVYKEALASALESDVRFRGEQVRVHRRASRAGHLGRPQDPISGEARNVGHTVTDWGHHGGGGSVALAEPTFHAPAPP